MVVPLQSYSLFKLSAIAHSALVGYCIHEQPVIRSEILDVHRLQDRGRHVHQRRSRAGRLQ